jgi:hypothetical protein
LGRHQLAGLPTSCFYGRGKTAAHTPCHACVLVPAALLRARTQVTATPPLPLASPCQHPLVEEALGRATREVCDYLLPLKVTRHQRQLLVRYLPHALVYGAALKLRDRGEEQREQVGKVVRGALDEVERSARAAGSRA